MVLRSTRLITIHCYSTVQLCNWSLVLCAARPRQSWWQRARLLTLRATGAHGATDEPWGARACVRAWECHALHAHAVQSCMPRSTEPHPRTPL